MAGADGDWQSRLYGLLDLTKDQKGKATFHILKLPQLDRELSVPRDQEIAVASMLELLRTEAPAAKAGPSNSGQVTSTSVLLPVDEGSQLPPAYKREVQRMIDQQSTRGMCDSVTTLGNRVLNMSTRKELIVVTPVHHAVATKWVTETASPAVREAWERALLPDSRLRETALGGVQEVFSNLLSSQPEGAHRLHDVHTVTSVCGSLKPDIIGCISAAQLPTNTFLILDLKRQDGSYNSPAHIHQIVSYGCALLSQLPVMARSSVLLGLSDLRHIQFLQMTRKAGGNGEYTYFMSGESEFVLASLCAVLEKPEMYGASPPPSLSYQGKAVKLVDLLGIGATASVFKGLVDAVHAGGGHVKVEAAAKVPLSSAHTTDDEQRVLEELRQGGCPGILHVLGKLDNGKGLLLQPVGDTLDFDTLLAHFRLFEIVPQLVDTLQTAHKLGWLHCDIRLDNIMLHDKRLFIIDWGCARKVKSCSFPCREYSGTSKSASDSVLAALSSADGNVSITPADDLQSLVKSIFILRHEAEVRGLRAAGKTDFIEIRKLWKELMLGRPVWGRLMESASKAEYKEVADGLAARLE